jgi:methyl-accepting chemotaxis protein
MRIGFGLSAKFLVIVGLAIAGMIVVGVLSLNTVRQNLLQDRKNKLVELTQAAYGVLDYYRNQAASGALTDATAREHAKAALRDLRFGQKDYFFVFDFDGINQVLGPKPELEGKSLLNLGTVDIRGRSGVPNRAEI